MQNQIKDEDIVSLLELQDKIRKKYLVEDLLGNNIKILLILESPHTDEIRYKYPVAGDTGIEISKYLLDEVNEPIGKYIKEHLDNSIYGIMNCCQIPMQESPYCSNFQKKEIFDAFKTIRKTEEDVEKRNNENTKFVDNQICNDLKRRLLSIIKKSEIQLIVPCGNMANYFINKCSNIIGEIEIYKDIPHPAYNNWSRKNDDIEKLRKNIDEIINRDNNANN